MIKSLNGVEVSKTGENLCVGTEATPVHCGRLGTEYSVRQDLLEGRDKKIGLRYFHSNSVCNMQISLQLIG